MSKKVQILTSAYQPNDIQYADYGFVSIVFTPRTAKMYLQLIKDCYKCLPPELVQDFRIKDWRAQFLSYSNTLDTICTSKITILYDDDIIKVTEKDNSTDAWALDYKLTTLSPLGIEFYAFYRYPMDGYVSSAQIPIKQLEEIAALDED